MHALPVIIVRGDQSTFTQGTLVELPPELQTPYQMKWYVERAVAGWNKCPQGYDVFVAVDSSGVRYVIPGLNILGEKRSKKKFYEQPYLFTKGKITDFAKALMEESTKVQRAKEEDLRDLIHDLRALSSAIYNSAIEARNEYDIGHASARDRIETVIATQTMLSIRIDLLDYLSSQVTLTELEQIEVFRKVDKVVRCFRPKANSRRINLVLQGPSFGATYGPAIFELVPYAIIDNAIKYAPNRSDIFVKVDDSPQQVRVLVVSLGPRIDNSERQKIFEKGYRGIHAIQLMPEGTGIGLHTAKELVQKHFSGSISVTQDDVPKIVDGNTYFSTQFEIVVPRRGDGG